MRHREQLRGPARSASRAVKLRQAEPSRADPDVDWAEKTRGRAPPKPEPEQKVSIACHRMMSNAVKRSLHAMKTMQRVP